MKSEKRVSGSGSATQEMSQRPLGQTGVNVSLVGLGGSHIGGKDLPADEAVRLIRAALDAGMNFMDNSWDYHDGESEKRLGRALRHSCADARRRIQVL